MQAVNFILQRRRGVSALRAKQVGLAIRLQFMDMILNDLKYMHPDENGQVRTCLATDTRNPQVRAARTIGGSSAPHVVCVSAQQRKAAADKCSIDTQSKD